MEISYLNENISQKIMKGITENATDIFKNGVLSALFVYMLIVDFYLLHLFNANILLEVRRMAIAFKLKYKRIEHLTLF